MSGKPPQFTFETVEGGQGIRAGDYNLSISSEVVQSAGKEPAEKRKMGPLKTSMAALQSGGCNGRTITVVVARSRACGESVRNLSSIKRLRHLRCHCCPVDWQGLAYFIDLSAHISFQHRRLKYQRNTFGNQMSNFLKGQY